MPNGNVSNSTDVCNQALGEIGHTQEIDDISTDQSTEATICQRFYGQARDEVLRAAVWPFAIHHAPLVLLDPAGLEGGVVPQGYRFAALFPVGSLRFFGLFRNSRRLALDASRDTAAIESGATPTRFNDNGFRVWHRNPAEFEKIPYAREADNNKGQILLFDEREPIAEFQKAPGRFNPDGTFTEDVTQWDADFATAVVMNLASKLAGPIKKDPALGMQKKQLYKVAIGDASASAEQELQHDPQPLPNFIRARNWGGGRGHR